MVSLATAKEYLRVTSTSDDALIERLIAAATTHLSVIGVSVDPEPEPVGEAILLLVSLFYRRTDRIFVTREEQIEGIGTTTFFDPKLIDEANWTLIRALTDPYREQFL